MASATTLLLVLLICILSPEILCQTISNCAPMLLPLTPCAPFVQGLSKAPTQTCCNNLNVVYGQQPECICLLLNNTFVSVLPINATLAFQLPLLCSLNLNTSTCSSSGISVPPASAPPTAQVSLGAPSNSTVAASPMVTVPPKRGIIMGYGFRPSDGMKLEGGGNFGRMIIVASAAVILLFKY